MRETVHPIDKLLLPLLHAEPDVVPQLTEQLVSEHALPVIRQVVQSKLCHCMERRQRADADDLQSEVLVQLLARLQAFRANPAQHAISNWRSYVAVATYHACYEFLRRQYPQYQQLKNRLRYLLTHQAAFVLYELEKGVWLAGLAVWAPPQQHVGQSARLQQLAADPEVFGRQYDGVRGSEPAQLAALLQALFGWLEQPVELDQLTNLVAQLCGLKFQAAQSLDDDEQSLFNLAERLVDPQTDVATAVAARLQLQRLWQEVQQLPEAQRSALLLNLRDEKGGNVIALLPHTGTATLRQIAEVLALSALELAELWPRLPLDDDTIGVRLNLTRQQIINLRLAARRRLTRRLWAYRAPVTTA